MLLVIVFMLGLSLKSKAQCMVDAGNDTVFCFIFDPLENYSLNASVEGGTPPYTYAWSCDVYDQILTYTFHYTASDYLNDTTLANPHLISGGNRTIVFHVTVTDSLGHSCTDSISILFDGWAFIPEAVERHIMSGDTTSLDGIFGGLIEPVTYLWSPTTGLEDPTDINTLAFPDTTTVYTLLTTDSAGCQEYSTATVYVYPVGVGDMSEEKVVNVYPNPLTEASWIDMGYDGSKADMLFYDQIGRLVKRIPLTGNKPKIERIDFEAGVYVYSILRNGQLVGNGKLVVQ